MKKILATLFVVQLSLAGICANSFAQSFPTLARTALNSEKGQAIVAAALKNPAAAEGLAKILGVKATDAMMKKPEAVRTNLLAKVNGIKAQAEAAKLDAEINNLLLLPNSGSTAQSSGLALNKNTAVAGNKNSETGSVLKSNKTGSINLGGGETNGGGAIAPVNTKKHLQELKDAFAERVKKSDITAQEFDAFMASAELHPEWIGNGIKKDCGSLTSAQVKNFMTVVAEGHKAPNEVAAVKAERAALARVTNKSLAEAKQNLCALQIQCQYINIPACAVN